MSPRDVIAPALVLLLLLGAWEAAAQWDVLADALDIRDFLIPAPSDIATSLWEDRELLAENAWVTLKEVVLGFSLAAVVGVGFAFLVHLSATARRAIYPLLVASQTIPIVAVAPILIVWFGFGIGPRLAIIALVCFFPITVNTIDGLRSVDPDLLKMMRTLGAGRRQMLIRAEAPAALPYAFSGAKVAVAVAVIGAVFGELAAGNEGLGHLINSANAQLLTARVFAAITVLSLIAIALFVLLSLLERRLIPWNTSEQSRRAAA
jgi:ABC-type nitrate/sulfonate/bicarbonate transport system permease component